LDTSGFENTLLNGALPYETNLLTELVSFIVDGVMLHGKLDGVFSKLTKLETLALPNNQLIGTIPQGLPLENINLKFLILSANGLTGTVPISIGSLSSLEGLQLDNNTFSGPVHEEIFHFTSKLGKFAS
jgi:Leucine-rich repeat (LRR) protein